MNRIKSLDGIRAVSILMVLTMHAIETMPATIGEHSWLRFVGNGELGVKIFFVISGFLITKLLFLEREKTGSVNIKDFYLRRIYRIFPVFYLYIAVILILKLTIIPDIFTNWSLLLFACFYFWNYKTMFFANDDMEHGNWFLGHFWSLSMEEQFYLFWPVLFIKVKESKLTWIVIVLMVLMPLARIATYFLAPDLRGQMFKMLHTGGDSILLGCLAAILERKAYFKEKVLKYTSNHYLMAAVALFLFVISPMITLRFGGTYSFTIGQTLNNIAIMTLIFWGIYVPSKVADFLNSAVMVRIGVLSYSIYIWQQLFMTNKNPFWINHFPQNLIIAFVVGFISYYGIEKPILKLKKRHKKPVMQVPEPEVA